MFLLVVSLALNGEYLKGQSTSDVSKFSSRPDIGIEDEPTINDDAEEEETTEEEDEPQPTDEEVMIPLQAYLLRDLLEQVVWD